jgi:hypothetical protein
MQSGTHLLEQFSAITAEFVGTDSQRCESHGTTTLVVNMTFFLVFCLTIAFTSGKHK